MPGRVHLAIEHTLARVTLSHPGKFNAMSRAMWRELKAVFTDLQARRDELRCVTVAGEGGHFCAGGDIAEYPDFRFDEDALRDFHENEVWGGLGAMLACDLPLVAQIEGNCMGAGVEIASCCDIRVAGSAARFGAPIARLGFPMAPREAQLVAREAGAATAREMLLEAAVLGATEMQARGFLHAVRPDAEVAADVQARAQRIAALAPQAARLNKQTLRALGAGQPIDTVVATAYRYADHAEHREGIAAFLAKRQPVF
ncbi:MAG: enoyl-CoA hydratase/isomerase family protein [Comamonadaceae bacterium]|nr:MAG: enoyl-CoA hydratase/isomerase family protein [Comamonadaceae bacterium]